MRLQRYNHSFLQPDWSRDDYYIGIKKHPIITVSISIPIKTSILIQPSNLWYKLDFVYLNLDYYKNDIINCDVSSSVINKLKSEVMPDLVDQYNLGNRKVIVQLVMKRNALSEYYYSLMNEKERSEVAMLFYGKSAPILDSVKFYTDGLFKALKTIHKDRRNEKQNIIPILFKVMTEYGNTKGLNILSKYISNRSYNWIGTVLKYCNLKDMLCFYNRHVNFSYQTGFGHMYIICAEEIEKMCTKFTPYHLIDKLVEFYRIIHSVNKWDRWFYNKTVLELEQKARIYNRMSDIAPSLLCYYLTHFKEQRVNYYYHYVLDLNHDNYEYSKVVDKLKFNYYMYVQFVIKKRIKSRYQNVLNMVDHLNVVYFKKLAIDAGFSEFVQKYKNIETEPTECVVCYLNTLRYTKCFHRLCSGCEIRMKTNTCPMCRAKLN